MKFTNLTYNLGSSQVGDFVYLICLKRVVRVGSCHGSVVTVMYCDGSFVGLSSKTKVKREIKNNFFF